MTTRAVLLLAFVGIVACTNEHGAGAEIGPSKGKWESLSLSWNDQSVLVDTVNDTLYLFEYERAFSVVPISQDSFVEKRRSIGIARSARDSIWLIGQRLMAHPVILEMRVTDYAGDGFRLKLNGGGLGTFESLSYGSQDGWPPEVQDLLLLKSLTFDRVPRP